MCGANDECAAAWNGTQVTAVKKIAPAIAAGNTFVFKASEKSPLGAIALGECIKEAGFPPGVINIVSGGGITGSLLAAHMNVGKISFTGSIASGRKVQDAATKSNLKRVTLECKHKLNLQRCTRADVGYKSGRQISSNRLQRRGP